MAERGAIRVKRGDTVSGYCARIYGIPVARTKSHWGEFFRTDEASGKLIPLADPNRIFAGETIYHRPDLVNGKKAAKPAPPPPVNTNPVSLWSREDKVLEAIKRSYPYLDDHTVEILKSMVTPEAVGIMVGVLVVWGASHFFGVGEIADVILLILGAAAVGMSVFTAAEHLYGFANKSIYAQSEADLDQAGYHFSRAVTILGVEAVMAILFKGRPKGTLKSKFFNKPVHVEPPPKIKGWWYKPKIKGDPHLPAGEGATGLWGDLRYSTQGSLETQRLVRIHERVHQLLTPKFSILRRYRVKLGIEGYNRSHLLRYIEEALAETAGQVGVNGLRGVFEGVSFPVSNGYVTIGQMSREAAGLVLGPVNVGGAVYRVWFNNEHRPE